MAVQRAGGQIALQRVAERTKARAQRITAVARTTFRPTLIWFQVVRWVSFIVNLYSYFVYGRIRSRIIRIDYKCIRLVIL